MSEGGDVAVRMLLELLLIVTPAHLEDSECETVRMTCFITDLALELVRPTDLAGVQFVCVPVQGNLLRIISKLLYIYI